MTNFKKGQKRIAHAVRKGRERVFLEDRDRRDDRFLATVEEPTLRNRGWGTRLRFSAIRNSSNLFATRPTNRELRPQYVQTAWMLSAGLLFGKGRAFDYIGDGGHELFSPAKIKMESDSEGIFQRELSRNVVGNV